VDLKKSGRNPVDQQLEMAGLILREGTSMSADKENVFFYSFLREQTHSQFDPKTLEPKQVFSLGH
jgi:hypothetical protein